MPGFLQTFAKLPTRSKALLGAGALGILLVAFFMLRLAGAPSYTVLAAGLDPAQTSKVTTALDEQAIAYELRGNGTAIAVEKAQAAAARVALAGQGVATGGAGSQEGWKLFDEQKLGASDMQQKVNFQRALEGEIANKVSGLQGVGGAQVQLVLPEDDLFADGATPATAAVLLAGSADAIEPGAVRGIAQLVASSVKDLKPANVTITDGAGQLLWPQGDMAGDSGGGSTKQGAEATYARQLEAKLSAMLGSTLGPGKARVQVSAKLNVDRTTRNELKYARRGVPLTTKTETERLRGGGAGAAGAAGTAGNVPTYSAAGAAANGNSNYRRETESTDFGVDKTVSKTEVAPGTVEGLQVALMLDQSVPPAAARGIQAAVASAAGIDRQRGDTISMTQLAFAKAPEPKTGPVPTTLLGPLKWVGLGLATLLFMFFMARHLRKREREELAHPAWLTTIEEPMPLAQLEAAREPATTMMATLPPRVPDPSLNALEQLMDREPERVAAQVKQWMRED
jgi:flagellar M-ring protein FliF